MNNFAQHFGRLRAVVIGMIHVRALPGSPRNTLSMEQVISKACEEAHIYCKANIDSLMLENMHDVPFLRRDQLGPETTAAMAVVATAVRRQHPHIPLGIQILSFGNMEALAIAKVAGLNFIRVEGWVFGHVGDEGYTQSCAAELTRYRCRLKAEDILIFTDIKKKHSSHAVTSDVTITQTAAAAELFLSDGVIITGTETGVATDCQQFLDVQKCVNVPVLIGSGVTKENVHRYINANALIVGSHFKQSGIWKDELESSRVQSFMDTVYKLREQDSK